MSADQINVSLTPNRQLARLTVKSGNGNGDVVHFSAADIERLIRLLAEARTQLQPPRAPEAKAGEKIDLTLNPAFGVTPPQKEGPVAQMGVILLADSKYGLLSYAFGRDQWEKLDAAVRGVLPPVS